MFQYSKILVLLILGTIFTHVACGSTVQHYITPSPTLLCPTEESCLTLSTLAANTSNYLESNTTLIFLTGHHTLDEDFTVTDVNEFLMLSNNDSVTVNITCSHNTHMTFTRITQMHIRGLKFIGCPSRIEFLDQFTLEDSSIHGGNIDDSALYIAQSNATIVRSHFRSNRAGMYSHRVRFLEFNRDQFGRTNIHSDAKVGGAIFINSSNIGISFSHFDGNAAEMGGAIFSQMGTNITISNCAFVNNGARGCRGKNTCVTYLYIGPVDCFRDYCHGGALFLENGCTLTATNNTFTNNTAETGNGGAIVLFQGTMFDTNNVFSGNIAYRLRMGGAIAAYDGSKLAVNNSYYERNEAGTGGVISVYLHCSITVDSSSFDSNKVNRDGGVMHAFVSSVNVNNSSFDKNNAKRLGGVMYAESSTSVTINNSFFANNNADRGGALGSRYSSITVDNIESHNCNGVDGGVIYVFSSNISVKDSSFNHSDAGYGGVLYALSRNDISVENSSFNDSTAEINGGVICASSSRITMKNSSFGNSKGKRGGVIFASDQSSIIANYTSFDNNTARDVGGVMYTHYCSSITIHNSYLGNNHARGKGGILYADHTISIDLDNDYFDSNQVNNCGGVIYAHGYLTLGNIPPPHLRTSINVYNSVFDENMASSNGGVLFALYITNITVDNSSFDMNTANNNGGILYADSTNNVTFKNKCIFFNNSASEGGVAYLSCTPFTDIGNMYYENMASTNGGVIASYQEPSDLNCLNVGVLNMIASSFVNNSAEINGGVICTTKGSYGDSVTLKQSTFHNNMAFSGGVIAMLSNASVPTLIGCTFTYNSAFRGGVIYLFTKNNLTVKYSNFTHNSAIKDGGVIYSQAQNQLIIYNSQLIFNNAEDNGGVLCSLSQSELVLTGNTCTFNGNQARRGGAVYANKGTVDIYTENLLIDNNTAIETGGAVHLMTSDLHFLNERSKLVGNQAHSGGALYSSGSRIDVYSQTLLMDNNSAIEKGGAICLYSASDISFFSDNSTLVGNQARSGGVLYASESRASVNSQNFLMAKNIAQVTGGAVHLYKANLTFFNGNSTIMGNEAHTSGGAVSLIESQLVFSGGNSMLVGNQADDGGAIFASESEMLLKKNSLTNVTANLATNNGGGLYLTESEIKVKGQTSYITRNKASRNGGGIHSDKSAIVSEGAAHFINNEAENGGGVSLEKNAKLFGMSAEDGSINFISNRASRHGGALYVDDLSNHAMCAAFTVQNATSLTECFSMSVFINFLDNFARFSGSNLFGGLLDRCSVNGELSQDTESIGVVSFLNSSNITDSELVTISSQPVRLCFCLGGRPDCKYNPELIRVNRGNKFSAELIAYNQLFNAVSAIVDSSVTESRSDSTTGYLGDDHGINRGCTKLDFNLFTSTSFDSKNLTLSMRGPCPIIGITEKSFMVEITCTCPIGFQIYIDSKTPCGCVCHSLLQPYDKTDCNASTDSIIRRENFWITYINHTNSSGYVIYPNCPFDYCYPPESEVRINLTRPNGSDVQCVSNRMGILCGTCKPGYSVSLGSSQCLQCPTNWPALLVTVVLIFIVSGVGLVALLLVLNLTVAIGSLNAIIFFANIMAANKSALFPSGRISFASVFISWLNFDLGVNICFYNGMDTYIKTWLQLAFPTYIIVLVVAIIKLSYYFTTFGRLVGRKDPVATLATLILLSYTKLIQTIITVFSSATLQYPDGPKAVWIPDGTVEYITGKHGGLFFIAILTLLLGFVYTLLLFSWQWLLLCPRKRFKWIISQKFSSFLETYHAPYTPRHRYWTGLLLLVRVSIYLLSAFDPSSGDPRTALLSTVVIVSLLFFYISVFGIRMYRHWSLNAMESLTFFNIIAVSVFTWYTFDTNGNQVIVTNLSVGIAFAQLAAVISYHTYKYTNQKLFQKFQSVIYKVKEKFGLRNGKVDQPTGLDTDVPNVQSKPTYSVVELPTYHNSESAESQKVENDSVVVKNKQSVLTENNQCFNHSSEIKATEHDDCMCTTSPAISCKHTSLNMQSNSCANSQIDSSKDVQLAKEETIEMSQFRSPESQAKLTIDLQSISDQVQNTSTPYTSFDDSS